MIKKTVGAHASELLQKRPESNDPVELERAMQEDYMKELRACIDENYTKYDNIFYVTVLTKSEKLMPNVFRNYFLARKTCPTPNYDQSVFRYNKESGRIEYLWTVPAKDVCYHLKENASQVVTEERMLLEFVMKFFDGSLLKASKKFNKEESDSNIIIQL